MDQDGDAALEDAVGEALDRVLKRVRAKDRVAAFRSLRAELERCLIDAPGGMDPDATWLRARLGAIIATHEPEGFDPVPQAGLPAQAAMGSRVVL